MQGAVDARTLEQEIARLEKRLEETRRNAVKVRTRLVRFMSPC